MQEVFGFVKRNMSGAQRMKSAASGERGVGNGAAALVPTQRWRDPERDQRSESPLTGWINTTSLGENHRRTSDLPIAATSVLCHVVLSKSCVDKHHSYLNATMGSTKEARRAGKYAAPADTAVIVTIASASVIGSVALMPNNRVVRNRVKANAADLMRLRPTSARRSAAVSSLGCLL